MALLNYNIRQITNNDIVIIEETDNYGNLKKYFQLDGKRGNIEKIKSKNVNGDIVEYEYFIFTTTHFGDLPMLKLGYICEPNAINIPIYIAFSGSTTYNRINIGKTGMFEIQPESRISDILTQEVEEEDIEFEIIGIKVPNGFSFSIDYIIAGDA